MLLPVLKPIWLAAYQPCGSRLAALLPEWLPAYEADHKQLEGGLRECLLAVSARTLDRLLAPLRAKTGRHCGTRPGSLLRQSIPIRGEWTEEGPGWLDSDNGGEFINHHVNAWLRQRSKPVTFTRSRPYRKNDNAHVEGRNWTHVRQHFGYERYDNPVVVPLINALCKGALGLMFNYFLPTHKLVAKQREGLRVKRSYGAALTPYARLLALDDFDSATKVRLRAVHQQHNPFQLRRDIERQLKEIESVRLLRS